jgi:Ion channel
VLVHATGVRFITNHVVARWRTIMLRPTAWRADVLMSSAVFVLLALHLLEMVLWAAALVYSGLVPDWRNAGFFAGNTYTTVGYGAFVLPTGWHMLAPIIAISGLFTFGWSGSVLVDLVGRCQKIKDAAERK